MGHHTKLIQTCVPPYQGGWELVVYNNVESQVVIFPVTMGLLQVLAMKTRSQSLLPIHHGVVLSLGLALFCVRIRRSIVLTAYLRGALRAQTSSVIHLAYTFFMNSKQLRIHKATIDTDIFVN